VLVADGASETAGAGTWTVATVDVTAGSVVKAGDVLATAATDDLEDQLAMARTSLHSAKVQEVIAEDALEDASDADETAAIRQAKIGLDNAVNGRRQAEMEVADLREQIGLATILAPIDGTVTGVTAVAGRSITGTAITMASAAYEVTTDVVEGDISEMAVGQPATVTVDAIGATIQGEVIAIAQAASADSGTSGVVSFPVTVSLTGAPSDLREGMTAEVSIVSASVADVLTVPSAALRGTAGDYRVQVLGADGVPVAQPVTVGLITESTVEIKEGLEAGQVVVTGTSASRTATGAAGQGPTTIGGGGGIAVPGTGPRGNFGQP
jgi:macrolide-specific efflux system membrane fusion protein